MTRQRLLELVAAVTSSDDATRRLAQHDLHLTSDAEHDVRHWAEPTVDPEDPAYRAWNEGYLASVGATSTPAA